MEEKLEDRIGYVGLHHVVTDIKHANPVIKVEFIKEFIKEILESPLKEVWQIKALIKNRVGDALVATGEGEGK